MSAGEAAALRILENKTDPLAVLGAATGRPIVAGTPASAVRMAYMALAALIHPDKLGPKFAQATEAFQVLVRSFDAFASGKVPKARAGTASSRKTPKAPKVDAPTAAVEEVERKPASKRTVRSDVARVRTPMSCPRCDTPWVPDTPVQYTLVMQHDVKIHCETCVLEYGWPTALHGCPHCRRVTDYHPDMFDGVSTCNGCHKQFAYEHHDVNPRILAQVEAKREAAERDEKDRRDREARAAQRAGRQDAGSELDMLVGQCIIDEQCPVCRKRVASKHRAHVEMCQSRPAVTPAPRVRRAPATRPLAKRSTAQANAGKKASKKPAKP